MRQEASTWFWLIQSGVQQINKTSWDVTEQMINQSSTDLDHKLVYSKYRNQCEILATQTEALNDPNYL